MYFTPKHIIDIASGTGGYLKQSADLLQNPPYAVRRSWWERLWAFLLDR